ncbi:MAG TPA: CAP domain-containing protein, partial [Thermoanaerobaculia bacterium]
MTRVGVILVLLAASANAQVTSQQLRAGESINGFPTWAERVVLEWINRARVDPQAELANCGAACSERACYTPQPPLYWDESLNHSARYHAAEMTKQGYFAHDSKCT